MSNLKCYIVRDLLPLYIDKTCSEQTSKDIEEHIESCEECQKLYCKMNEDFKILVTDDTYIDEKKLFSHAKKSIVMLISPLIIFAVCSAFNMYGVLLDKNAGILNLIFSTGCILSWSFFIFHSRKYRPMINLSMAASFIIFLSSAVALAQLPPGIAGHLTDLLSLIAGVPFYGMTYYMSWKFTFSIAAVISFCCLLYSFAVKYLLIPGERRYTGRARRFSVHKRILLTMIFFVSFIPMLFNQYGGCRGVQEISGLINLFNPIGILSVCVFLVGVWGEYKSKKINRILGALGSVGITASELYKFFTWHILTITGKTSLEISMQFALPEFYIGLLVSLCMIAAFFVIDKKFE